MCINKHTDGAIKTRTDARKRTRTDVVPHEVPHAWVVTGTDEDGKEEYEERRDATEHDTHITQTQNDITNPNWERENEQKNTIKILYDVYKLEIH